MRPELARLCVVLLHRYVLELGLVGDDQLDHGVDVRRIVGAVLLDERRLGPPLQHDQNTVIRGRAVAGDVEDRAQRLVDLDPRRDVQEHAVHPVGGVGSGELLAVGNHRAEIWLDQRGLLGNRLRQMHERDRRRRVPVEFELGLLDGVGVGIEATQVGEPPRLFPVRRHRQRVVHRLGSLAHARQPGGLGQRVQPTDPSICSWIRRFISTAYSSGSSLVIGSMKPETIMAEASASLSPRLIR